MGLRSYISRLVNTFERNEPVPTMILDPKLRFEAGEWLVLADEYVQQPMQEPFISELGTLGMREASHLLRREKILYRGKDKEAAEETIRRLKVQT